MVVNVGLAWWLAPSMGVQGLALAFSLAAIVNVFLLLGFLHWRLGGFDDRRVLLSMLRIVVATILAGAAVQGLKYPVAAVVDMQRLWGVFTQLVVAASGGVAVYLAIAMLLKSEELAALRKYVPRRATVELPPGTDTTRFGGLME
jgi:putative peptidoglycan lipid II flippase